MAELHEILITEELTRRPRRAPDHAAESAAYRALARELARSSEAILQTLSQAALDLCRAHSAGVSVLEHEGPELMFRWRGLAGRWAHHVNGGLPREASPCGAVVDRNRTLLVRHPERHFAKLAGAVPEICEALLAPFQIMGEPVGTVWVLAHDESRRFDGEDARLVEGLAEFAGAAFMMSEALARALDTKEELARSQERLLRTNERLWARLTQNQAEPSG